MDVFIFIIFSSIFLDIEALDANCPSVKCGNGGPDIRFPFRFKGQQPEHCGQPSFELICKGNNTVIQFPSYGDLIVKSISYDTKKLNLLDPKNCVHEVFLNLNLSLTPFHYYYAVKKYTYLNCSASLSPSFTQVPCLSGSAYHVYVVESSLVVPVSCKPQKTLSIPFSYSPYLSDNSFGLGLTWELARSEYYEKKGVWRGFESLGLSRYFNLALGKVVSISIFLIMVATLLSVKTYCSKKLPLQKEKKNQYKVEKLLGEYGTTEPAINSNPDVKGMSNLIKTTVGHGNCGKDFEYVWIVATDGNVGEGSLKKEESRYVVHKC